MWRRRIRPIHDVSVEKIPETKERRANWDGDLGIGIELQEGGKWRK